MIIIICAAVKMLRFSITTSFIWYKNESSWYIFFGGGRRRVKGKEFQVFSKASGKTRIVRVAIVSVDERFILYRGYEKKGSSRENIEFVMEKYKIKFSIEINLLLLHKNKTNWL